MRAVLCPFSRLIVLLLTVAMTGQGAFAAPIDVATIAARDAMGGTAYVWAPVSMADAERLDGETGIAAGTALNVALAPRRALRITGPGAETLSLSVSRDGALWLKVTPERVNGAVTLRGGADPLLVSVFAERTSAEVRLETTEAVAGPLVYEGRATGDVVTETLDTGRVRRWVSINARPLGATPLEAAVSDPLERAFTVSGPALVRLDLRAAEAGPAFPAVVLLDGRVTERLTVPAGIDARTIIVRDDTNAVGRAESVFLRLPAGEHRLEVAPAAPVLARLSTVADAADDPGAEDPAPIPETLSPDAVAALLERAKDGALPPLDAWRLARRLAWDTSRDAALDAAALLDAAAGTTPEGLAAADDFRERHTFFRPLEPAVLPDGSTRVEAAVVAGEVSIKPSPPLVAEVSLRTVPTPPVLAFHQGDAEPLVYALEPVHAPRRLRVSLPATAVGGLRVVTDGGAVFELHADGAPDDLRPDPNAAAMFVAAPDHVTAPLMRRVFHDLHLPPGTRTVSLTVQGNGPVALEIETGAQERLDERGFLAVVAGDPAWLREWLAGHAACAGDIWSCIAPAAWRSAVDPEAVRALLLANDLIPVIELVAARMDTLAGDLPSIRGDAVSSGVALDEARRLIAAGDPVAALVSLRGLRGWDGPVLTGRRLQAEALLAAGELYLSERLLLMLAIHRPQTLDGGWAYDRLRALFADRGDHGALAGLAGSRFAATGDEVSAQHLIAALTADGHADSAVRFGLAGGFDGATADAALAAGWFTAAARLGAPPDPWAGSLAEARALSREIWTRTDDRSDLPARLMAWWHGHPGQRVLVPAPGLVRRHAGALRLRSLSRDLGFTAYRATRSRPLVLSVPGPADVMLSVRPLHERAAARDTHERAMARDTWIELQVDGVRQWVPASDNAPSPGLEVAAGDGGLPGTEVLAPLALGPGLHRVTIAAVDGALAIRPLLRMPAPAPDTLPPPLPDALSALAVAPSAPAVEVERRGPLAVFRSSAWPELAAFGLSGAHGEPALPPGGYAVPQGPAETMAALVKRAEEQGLSTALLAEAADLAEVHHGDRAVQRLFDHLRRLGVRWDPALSPLESAGIRLVETDPLAAVAPATRVRLAMLESEADAHLFRGQAFELESPAGEAALTARFTMLTPPGLPRGVIVLAVSGAQDRLVTIGPDEPVTMSLAGSTRLEVVEAPPSHVLAVAFEGAAAPLFNGQTRTWHVATADQPLVLAVDGPVWVRIDRLRGGTVTSEHRIARGGELVLRSDGAEETLYRVFRYLPTGLPAPRERAVLAAAPSPSTPPLRSDRWPDIDWAASPGAAVPVDAPSDRTAGVVSIGTAFTVRRSGDPIGADSDGADTFFSSEVSADWRKRADGGATWWRVGGLARYAANQDPVVGLRAGADHVLDHAPVTFDLDVALWSQGDAMHAEARGGASWARDLDENVRLRLSGDVLARALQSGDGGKALDPDVWSRYKADHRWGGDVEAALEYQPRARSEAFMHLGMRSNENFTPDHYRLTWGWRELVGSVVVEATHRLRHFPADEHRATAVWRNTFGTEMLWEHWRDRQGRWEAGLGVDYGIEQSALTAGLRLTLHLGSVRGYDDFAPGAIDFERLRRAWAPAPGRAPDGP